LCRAVRLTIRFAMQTRTLALLAAPLLLLGTASCHKQAAQEQQPEAAQTPAKGADRSHAGEAMPATLILNADDDSAALADARGKPMLVNLWASWCAPCVKELPTLDALSKRPGAPRVIAVSEDIGDRTSVEAFLDHHGIKDLEAWRDPKMALSGALGAQVMPTSVYYDASGREVWRYTGDLDWTSAEAAKLLSEAGETAKR
jgi:thiol-disulfide isomerase/thioredoxin